MNQRQIEKLRRKFFLLSSIAFILVILFVGGVMFTTNQIVLRSQIRATLSRIAAADGNIYEIGSQDETRSSDETHSADETRSTGETRSSDETRSTGETRSTAETRSAKSSVRKDSNPSSGEENTVFHTPTFYEAFGPEGYLRQLSESRLTMRFFAVLYDEDMAFEEIRTNLMELPSSEYALEAAQEVLENASRKGPLRLSKRYGTYDVFSYLVTERSSGGSIVVFLDVSSNINDSNRLFYTALILIGFGSIAVLLVMRALSFSVIKPEIRNAQLQKQFITNASHELKTPLAVIRANTELEQMINGENEWNQSTLRQVDRMNGLIANLVMIARAEEKEDAGEMTLLDVSKLVRETADTFLPVAQQDGKQFEISVPEGILLTAEESDIRQLSSVLIDNAIKYCDEHGTIRVTLAALSRGRQIRLEVSNSYGEGKEIDYSRFFGRFYRQDESHNADRGGYGIGLSIAETLVNKYHGSIDAGWKDGMITFKAVL